MTVAKEYRHNWNKRKMQALTRSNLSVVRRPPESGGWPDAGGRSLPLKAAVDHGGNGAMNLDVHTDQI